MTVTKLDTQFYKCIDHSYLSVQVVTCICTEGWLGDDCSVDHDSCEEKPCYPGVQCIDQPPPATMAECGNCPPGLLGDGFKCFGMYTISITGFVIEELDSVKFIYDVIFCFESDSIVVSYSSSTGFLRIDVIIFGKPSQLRFSFIGVLLYY